MIYIATGADASRNNLGQLIISSELYISSGSSSQNIELGVAIAPIVYTWGGDATGVTVTGLTGTGLTAAINSTAKTVTISGTPTVTTSISYVVTTTGSSNTVTANGSITINLPAQTLTLTSGSNNQVVTSGAITPIVYTWGGGAAGVTVTGLIGTGLTAAINSTAKTVTISGTPTVTVDYTITTTGTGNLATATGHVKYGLDAATTSLLNVMGKTWDADKAIAIDTFLTSLNAASWKSKIKALQIPILFPATTGLTASVLNSTSASKYNYNIASAAHDLIITTNISATYALISVLDNGFAFENGTNGLISNIYLRLVTTGYNLTNKKMHYGVFFKASTSFASTFASTTTPSIIANSSSISANAYNSFSVSKAHSGAYKGLVLINADVNNSTGKSYVYDSFVGTTVIGTTAETVQSAAGLLQGTSNLVGDSTCCLVTNGDYLTDSELTEYVGLINNLMESLIVG